MSSCSVPANQPIYQALLDKAASYPADKPYKAKAYNKAAESVRAWNYNLYNDYIPSVPSVGVSIQKFIEDFIKTEVFPTLTGAAKAMDDARKAAAAAAPKDITSWPKDDDRAAFLAKVEASKKASDAVVSAIVNASAGQYLTAQQIADIIKVNITPKPVEPPKKTEWELYLESMKPVAYTAENPRRSRRLANKPKVEYFTKEDEEDEQDEIAEAIEAVCAKKGWAYSDELVTDFETWLPTADTYSTQKYDYRTGKYIPRSKPDVAKYWTQYYSTSIQKQKKRLQLSKGLIKYCEKNNIEYQDLMADKFAAWMADPANKKLITKTYKSYGGCSWGSCNPTGTPPVTSEYSYELGPTACINKWFSTLKKTIVW